jgi:hypothetical protein
MIIRKFAGFLLAFTLLLPANGFAEPRPLEMKWGELSPVVTGHRVTVTLSDGITVKGEAVAVREDGLLLNVSSEVKGYPKGNGSVPRASIALIDVQRTNGSGGRILGTVVGFLGGVALGAYIDSKSVLRDSSGAIVGTFVGVSAAGTISGYAVGRAIDKRVMHIRIVP